jgi:hypothetical protein
VKRPGWIVPLLIIAACSKEREGPGRLEVGWTGTDSGRLNVAATAQWCPVDSTLEITGIEGDSGVAVAIFPVDTIRPGVYPAGAPGQGMARPRAGVAFRRFGENLILGYYSMSGTVTVDSGFPLHGSLQATLKSVNTGDQVNLSGGFRGLAVEPGGPMCRDTLGGNVADTVVR